MIILIASRKGGCGKSTVAINLCALLANQGKDVLLVDADTQPSSTLWAQDRAENDNLPTVKAVQATGRINDTLKDLGERYEFVVVDAAGRDSTEMRTGLLVADVVIIPLRPSQFDLGTLPAMEETISQAKDFNPGMQVYALLNAVSTNPQVKEAQEATDLLHEFPEIQLLKSILHARKVYGDSVINGKGVIEMDNPKAKDEVSQLLKEIL